MIDGFDELADFIDGGAITEEEDGADEALNEEDTELVNKEGLKGNMAGIGTDGLLVIKADPGSNKVGTGLVI